MMQNIEGNNTYSLTWFG